MHAYCTVLLSTYYKCGGSDTFWFWSLIWSNPTFHSVRSLFHILLSFSVKSNLGQAKIPNYSSNFQPFHFFEILDRVSENPWIRIRIRITEFTYWLCSERAGPESAGGPPWPVVPHGGPAAAPGGQRRLPRPQPPELALSAAGRLQAQRRPRVPVLSRRAPDPGGSQYTECLRAQAGVRN